MNIFQMKEQPHVKELRRGIGIRHNKNGFTSMFVHYTADPDKDPLTPKGRKWLKEATQGVDLLSWEKENEISFFAKSGEVIYPEFGSMHLIEPFPIPKDWTRYQAIDPGFRNPCAALWAAVDPLNTIFLYREHYVARKETRWHAQEFLKEEKKAKESIARRLIDPSSDSTTMNSGLSIKAIFANARINTVASVNNASAAITKIKEKLRINVNTKLPGIYVMKHLRYFRYEVSQYRWEQITSEKMAARKDPIEKPQKINDHLMNCLEYLIHGRIRYLDPADYRQPINRSPAGFGAVI